MAVSADASHIIRAAGFSRIIAAGNQFFIITADAAYARAASVYRAHIVTVGNLILIVAADTAHIFAAAYGSCIITDTDNAAVIIAADAARIAVPAYGRRIIAACHGSPVGTAHTARIAASRNIRSHDSQIPDRTGITSKQSRTGSTLIMKIQPAHRKGAAVKSPCIWMRVRTDRHPRTGIGAAYAGQINILCQRRAQSRVRCAFYAVYQIRKIAELPGVFNSVRVCRCTAALQAYRAYRHSRRHRRICSLGLRPFLFLFPACRFLYSHRFSFHPRRHCRIRHQYQQQAGYQNKAPYSSTHSDTLLFKEMKSYRPGSGDAAPL